MQFRIVLKARLLLWISMVRVYASAGDVQAEKIESNVIGKTY
jgi:hypothetical protein